MRRKIYSPECPAPIGPYSQAIAAAGEFIFVSGQLPIVNGVIPTEDVSEQTRLSMTYIGHILAAGGYTWADVVKATVYLQDMGDFAAMNEVYKTFVVEDYPARVAFQVAKLPMNAKVEIDAIAVK